jgi:hypothetical protein
MGADFPMESNTLYGVAKVLGRPNAWIRNLHLSALAACVLIAGTLDISDALIFYGLRGSHPLVLLQVIASGLIGPTALRGGVKTALLGLAIHYTITCAWAALFLLAVSKLPIARWHPLLSGTLYGLLVYVVMTYLVVPHTRLVGHPHFHLVVFVNAVLALVFCIGIPIAYISRATLFGSRRRIAT